MASDQIDKFHGIVCRWHLYDDVVNCQAEKLEMPKKFYSSEEYLDHQKMMLF